MRVFGRIFTSIWNDDDFRTLSGDAQRLYLMLITQPEISSCGMLPITFRRWSNNATDTPIDSLSIAFRELIDRRYLVADEDREEVLARTFVKWDEGYKVPKRLIAVIASAKAASSPLLRQVVAHELTKLGVPHDIPIGHIDTPIDTGIDSPLSMVTTVDTTWRQRREPETETETESSRNVRNERGSRLPDDWRPAPQLIEWVKQECPAVNGRTETEQFRDYWHSSAGKTATKRDWSGAYRVWMRRAQEQTPRQRTSTVGVATSDQRAYGALALAQRLAQREADTEPLEIEP